MGQDMSTLSPAERKARQISEMDEDIKFKLRHGANYNMKVVIKGDKNTGKTCLFRRLQRLSFVEDYVSTDQIQIATIPWDYKVSNDKIKVEVWDVVDRARGKKKEEGVDGLKVSNPTPGADYESDEDSSVDPSSLPKLSDGIQSGAFSMGKLDAQSVDVYKDVNAVLFVIDPRKKWTLDYVDRELPEVPKNTFVLILANYRDCPQNQRVITEYELQEYARNAGKYVRYLECSMKNCYGMKGIGCFFNLPFLKIKRQYIVAQLKENEADLDAADQEYVLIATEQNYHMFYTKWLEENKKSRKAQAPSALPDGPPLRPSVIGTTAPATAAPTTTPAVAPTAVGGALDSMKRFVTTSLGAEPTPEPKQAPLAQTPPAGTAQKPAATAKPAPTAKTAPAAKTAGAPQPKPKPKPTPAVQAAPQPKATPAPAAEPASGLSSWTSRIWGSKPEPAPKKPSVDVEGDLKRVIAKAKETGMVPEADIDDFAPAAEGDADFWKVDDDDSDEEVKPNKKNKGGKPKKKDTFSSSDDDAGPSFSMVQDEAPDFPEESVPVVINTPVRVQPKTKTPVVTPAKPVETARSAPVTPAKVAEPVKPPKPLALPEQPKQSKKEEPEEDTGYDEFLDKSSDEEEDEAEKEARLKRERKEKKAKTTKKRFTILQDQDPFANDSSAQPSTSAPTPPSPLNNGDHSPRGISASYGDLPDATNGESKRRRHRDRAEGGERRTSSRHRDREGRERARERRGSEGGSASGGDTPEARKHRGHRKERTSRSTSNGTDTP